MSKHTRLWSTPWPNWWRLARMRSIGPVRGTRESSSAPLRSFAKSTSAWKAETSPSRSASACAFSRHQEPSSEAPTPESTSVRPPPFWSVSGIGSSKRNAMLNSAGLVGRAPPGLPALRRPGCGCR
jgi:hypothetical protein